MPADKPIGLLLSIAGLCTGCSGAQPVVRYRVDLASRAQQIVRIEAEAPAVDGAAEFVLPVWRPGRYGVLDFSSGIRTWSATDANGGPLNAHKIRKNAWRVEAPADTERVVFSYEIYADSLGSRTRHVDDSHAFLSGSSVFVLSPEHRWDEHSVEIQLPEGWDVATGLQQADGTLIAPSYDVLMDSPMEIGTHQSHSFDSDGVETEVAIWGDVSPDWETIEADFRSVAEAEHGVFGGDVHIDRYVYIVHAYPGGGGGTEHLNSSVCQTRPKTFRDDGAFTGFMSLIAHEYFHTWNVKRFRPVGIVPYDFDRENYTTMLWLVEGTTSYYDDLVLVRAGLTTPDSYHSRIGSSITSVMSRPGRTRSSLSQSSYDAWLKFWGPSSPDHSNTSVNIYTHGAMASMTLDLLIRDATDNAASLDSVMQAMASSFDWHDRGYTQDDVRRIVAEISGQDMGWFFDEHVDGTMPPPFERALAAAGLELTQDEPDGTPAFGASTSSGEGGQRITRLVDGSPAFLAGLNVGDVIVSVDGESVESTSLGEMIDTRSVGDTAAVGIFRRGGYREIPVLLDQQRAGRFRVDQVEQPTDRQIRIYESWLGRDWDNSEAE